ncbi:type 2 isopentenyl-diphosphate Delta-isomerase [Legionella worsleiensis]|uniref:Isopentenyl-diphosphate delta-isomerase n=1 Tax=Legionella worsleiensis TaxID=45076 RepID=A0A0W1AIU6_9GAMM|nr:type 2 isopentenyl-diphosphate Delta-isomerase [Legionella worsleiensis]KTD81269.1 isopentenyl pyrophosphate isomerase [Legionella worsleiensis]STY30862.1 isopentenyl-diphosphate delta-isomerase [Legionella worsleiensis]
MQNDYTEFEQRKQDHIELALMPANQSSNLNPFDRCYLIHEALPDINFNEISIQSTRFKRHVDTPFFISSMTAGHAKAPEINRRLLEACAESKWAMGVGSQRRELTDNQAAFEWAPLRRDFPDTELFSNLGIAQIINTPLAAIQRLVDSLQATALIIHCNPLQECIQPEGTTEFKGCWNALSELVRCITVPVIVKETGCGFSPKTLMRLNETGICAVDVSGAGGTHWGRIEGHRAAKNSIQHRTANTFMNWGIDTLQSVKNAVQINPHFEVWGSGGVRHGLDAAKLIAHGATSVGFAKPLLESALQTTEHVLSTMRTIEYELKTAMFCTGSQTLSDLREKVCL